MKRFLCLVLAVLMMLGTMTTFASEDITLLPENADYSSGVTVKDGVTGYGKGDYVGFSGVDLTGINSVKFTGKFNLGVGNGETVRIHGFGNFVPRPYGERKCYNPRTGKNITLPASVQPAFIPGKKMRVMIQK